MSLPPPQERDPFEGIESSVEMVFRRLARDVRDTGPSPEETIVIPHGVAQLLGLGQVNLSELFGFDSAKLEELAKRGAQAAVQCAPKCFAAHGAILPIDHQPHGRRRQG